MPFQYSQDECFKCYISTHIPFLRLNQHINNYGGQNIQKLIYNIQVLLKISLEAWSVELGRCRHLQK